MNTEMKKTCFPLESEGLRRREPEAQKTPRNSLGLIEDFPRRGVYGGSRGSPAKPGSTLVQGGHPPCEC